jgi:hypothetical protein
VAVPGGRGTVLNQYLAGLGGSAELALTAGFQGTSAPLGWDLEFCLPGEICG